MAVIAACVLGFVFREQIADYLKPQPTETDFSVQPLKLQFENGSRPSFYAADGRGFFYATRQGVRYLDFAGNEKASAMFSMSAPVIKAEGNIVAISEAMGDSIHVFGSQGLVYERQTEYPVITFCVNSSGYTAVITKRATSYGVTVYNQKGGIQSEGQLSEENIFPTSCDISNDGRILTISTLDINDIHMKSKIMFIYVTKSDSMDIKDGIYAASADYPDQIISHLEFMQDNKLLAFSDKELKCFDAGNNGKLLWVLTFQNRVEQICYMNGTGFAIAFGEPLLNQAGETPGLCRVYNMNLDTLSEFVPQSKSKITQLSYAFKTLLVANGRDYYALNDKAELLWKYSASQDVRQVVLIEGSELFVVSVDSGASFIKVNKVPVAATPAP